MKISATIITKNEEENIVSCIESVNWCDEIIVVDSGSVDNTVKVAESLGAKVFVNEFEGFGKQKQFAVEKTSNDWVLSIDADEIITNKLRDEIKNLGNSISIAGYRIKRNISFMNRELKFGTATNETILRLFNKQVCKFTENSVHEKVITKQKTATLKNKMLHTPYRNIHHYFEKLNQYTTLMAKQYHTKGKSSVVFLIHLKQLYAFVTSYFLKLGFLDGPQGLIWSTLHSFYTATKYIKLYEIKLSQQRK